MIESIFAYRSAGRDCFLLSALVGTKGRVVGVDMTPEQLDVANKNIEYHRKKFGYLKTNVEYYQGAPLAAPPLVISTCVLS
jgi:tRNA A58 N-methylase Trm61